MWGFIFFVGFVLVLVFSSYMIFEEYWKEKVEKYCLLCI